MLNQNDVREKIQSLKGGVKNLINRFHVKADQSATDQADGIVDSNAYNAKSDIHEYTPETDDTVGTAPRSNTILSDGSRDAQDLVWDNEDASMQDKSYSFDEETTDADYDLEDSLEFEEDSDGGQESRYS